MYVSEFNKERGNTPFPSRSIGRQSQSNPLGFCGRSKNSSPSEKEEKNCSTHFYLASQKGPQSENLHCECDGCKGVPHCRESGRQAHGRKYGGVERQRLRHPEKSEEIVKTTDSLLQQFLMSNVTKTRVATLLSLYNNKKQNKQKVWTGETTLVSNKSFGPFDSFGHS